MKKLFTCFLMVLSYVAAMAQYTYDASYHADGGNPGGLNANSDATTTGYTKISTGGESSNFWTTTQALPFAFSFYGTPVTHYKVSGNGVVTFDTTVTALPVDANTNLPAIAGTNIPNNSILGFWDAFTGAPPIATSDNIWVAVYGTAPNRQLWINYFSYEYGSTGSAAVASFAYWDIVLEETTNKIYVVDKNYHSGGNLLTSTIGVQKDAATAVQWGDNLIGMGAGSTGAADNDYYQFTPRLLVSNNAAVASIDNPTLPTCALANQDVKATILNDGNNAINTVTVNWAINGVAQTPLAYATPLAVGATAQVTLGNYTFNAFDNLEVWTSIPNGMADGNPANDSASLVLATGLVGTFTIDSLLPTGGTNFKSFGDAIAFIGTAGLCGPTTFNVAPGTWNESIILPSFGNNANNPIIFNGAGQGLTTLKYNGAGISNETISFTGADWVTFKNMTIQNTEATSYGWAIRFSNASDHNTIDSCRVIVDKALTSSLFAAIISSGSATSTGTAGNNASYTTIRDCTIEGGYYSIRLNGASTTATYNVYNTIENCTIKDYYAYGLYGLYQDSLTLIGNTVEGSRSSSTTGYGIYASSSRHPNFQANWVKDSKSYGIYLSSVNTTTQAATGRGKIINNMVSAKGDAEALYLVTVNNLDIFHNSFYATDEQALYMSGVSTGMDFRNNIFANKANHAIDFATIFSGIKFDYNLIYREDGGSLAKDGTSVFPDLGVWQVSNPALNTYSIQGNPNFVDVLNHDLHVNVGPGLIKGDNSVGVATDFDGDPRPWAPTTIVDIGADEIFVQNLDAQIVSLDAPIAPVSSGLQNIKVSIRNNGATPLTAVTINWTANGVLQTPFAWTGNLTIGNQANNITIGQYNIPSGFTPFEIWTSAPNGGVDGNPSNDTLVYDLCTALSGTYTVGAAPTDDFATVADAADAVMGCGISGPVTINIAPGTYTDPISLRTINGSSVTNTVTFDGISKDSVLITHSAGVGGRNETILFDGADYIIIQNVTVENTGVTNAWGIRLQNASDYNTIKDSRIIMDTVSTSSLICPILSTASSTGVSTQGNNCNYLKILNNEIIGGYYGVRLYGEYLATNEALLNKGNRIEGNTFKNTYIYGIYVYYQANTSIVGNTIPGFRSTTSGYGIYAYMTMDLAIETNLIANAGTYGVYLSSANSQFVPLKRGKIVNNMISVNNVSAEALYIINIASYDMYHNTLHATGEQALYIDNFSGMDIRNNIFTAETNTVVDFIDALGVADVVNYNVYHRYGSGILIENGAANYNDLAAWQTGNVGVYDANSKQGDPIYKDVSIGDLHAIGGVANDVGDNTVPVARDIDGQIRPMAPSTIRDIGADEYTPLNDDAIILDIDYKNGICSSPTDTVKVTVQNLGLTTITTLPITVQVTGSTTASVSTIASVNMPFLSTETIIVGTFNSIGGGDYAFTAYTSLAGDQNLENDTISGISGKRLSSTGMVTDVTCLGDTSGAIDFGLVNPLGLDSKITTNFASNNGCNASYFDVNVIKSNGLTITGFEVNMGTAAGTPITVELYYKTGTWVGFDANGATGWTYAGAMTGIAAGNNLPSVVTLPSSITLPAGINGIFISGGSGWRYINGTAAGALWASNGDVEIFQGGGVCANPIGAGGTILTRNFSGSIIYQGAAATYTWSTADTTEDLTGLVGGTYYVTATDGIGCTVTDSFTVNQPTIAPPTATLGTVTDVSCFGLADGSVMASVAGGVGTLTYNWSNGATSQNLTNIGSGAYSLVVSDANGCADSTSVSNVMVAEPDELIATLDTVVATACNTYEISANVTGGNGGNTYAWTGGSNASTLTVTATGAYTLTVTDTKGCSDNFTTTVTLPTALTATATVTAADTAGAGVGAASVAAAGGTMPYTYAWSNGQTTMTATGLAAGSYTATVTDANGCVVTTAQVTVGFPTGLTGIEAFQSLEMFPNPTTGMVTFHVALKSSSDLTITIFDIAGREITNFTSSNAMTVTENFDTSSLPEGVYMVRFIAGEDGVVTKRLVVGAK
jgi:trimeric autotransporter adhesin